MTTQVIVNEARVGRSDDKRRKAAARKAKEYQRMKESAERSAERSANKGQPQETYKEWSKRMMEDQQKPANWLADEIRQVKEDLEGLTLGQLPESFRRNIDAFLRNRAREYPSYNAWRWLIACWPEHGPKLYKPFRWVMKVLSNPWGAERMAYQQRPPDDAWKREQFERRQSESLERATANVATLSRESLESEDPHEAQKAMFAGLGMRRMMSLGEAQGHYYR